ncbi:hypothetical protein AMS68_004688 [Peltaster fructicola]|uniref:Major facilitator superfamily (MFS) profile domain-containing protein n=1 Tax=Peltaster fructicola TaxID=286661 RepID=A0A6H0XWY1_9PEZI|nr:hypothetical protein AMS68_004688 [Peltaster fructicola]
MRSPTSDVSQTSTTGIVSSRPKLNFARVSSLDRLLAYHEELAAYDKYSASTAQAVELSSDVHIRVNNGTEAEHGHFQTASSTNKRFRSLIVEVGFCFTIAMTQLLSELYISGFALVLVDLVKDAPGMGSPSTGSFWPAAVLSLVISATLLIWARISDMHGGYLPLMFGLLWLTIWSIMPAIFLSLVVLNIARAMQGLAIAALMPSVFVLLGHAYDDSRRKNIVLGIYGACAPLGFYAGFVVAGLLPPEHSSLFFLVAGVLSFLTMVTAFLSVPHDTTDRHEMHLKMDWLGAFCIISGLILIDYALAAEPRQAELQQTTTAFQAPLILCPLLAGIITLGVAVWVEGWHASCPLLPFDFFRPEGLKSFCLACVFLYGSFGVWLYTTSEYFSLPMVTEQSRPVEGMQLVLWYTPLLVFGITFSLVGGAVAKWLSLKVLICVAGIAYIGASLVFATAPVPLHFWLMVLPSMVCASLGTDLTFTISNIFLTVSQPRKYQGMAGAVSSILFNLGVSFALPISEIAFAYGRTSPQLTQRVADDAEVSAYRRAFLCATASATAGLLICVFCFPSSLRSPVTTVKGQTSSASSVSEVEQA